MVQRLNVNCQKHQRCSLSGVLASDTGLVHDYDDYGKYVLCLTSVFWPCGKVSVSQTATV